MLIHLCRHCYRGPIVMTLTCWYRFTNKLSPTWWYHYGGKSVATSTMLQQISYASTVPILRWWLFLLCWNSLVAQFSIGYRFSNRDAETGLEKIQLLTLQKILKTQCWVQHLNTWTSTATLPDSLFLFWNGLLLFGQKSWLSFLPNFLGLFSTSWNILFWFIFFPERN